MSWRGDHERFCQYVRCSSINAMLLCDPACEVDVRDKVNNDSQLVAVH